MARLELPVTDITRTLTTPPALFTATGSDGFYFENLGSDVFLEVISTTTGQQFTVLTGKVIEDEWSLSDDLVSVSAANTTYKIGSYPSNIYNQPDGSNQVWVDHSVSAVLQFRAWRLT